MTTYPVFTRNALAGPQDQRPQMPQQNGLSGGYKLAGYDAPYSQEAATRGSYSDHDLGNARQPIDPDYAEWRQRAIDARMREDAGYDATLQAVQALRPGYRPRNGVGMMNNVEDRRLDGERETAHHQFLADQMRDDEPSYAGAYGPPLPGPRY